MSSDFHNGGAGLLPGDGVPGLVSVVVPTFNRGYIIASAIQSILDQSHKDVEVIVVDDGSTDDTASVVSQFDSRVRYVSRVNGGVSCARNTGIRLARGEFVAFLDADDKWLPWKLTAQIAVFNAFKDVGMVWTDICAFRGASGGRPEQIIEQHYLRTFYSAYATSEFGVSMRRSRTSGRLRLPGSRRRASASATCSAT